MLTDMETAILAREMREGAGLSVRGLAKAAGVSPSTVHRIEMGDMSPTVELFRDLAEAVGARLTIVPEYDYGLNIVGLAHSFRADVEQRDESNLVRKAAEFVQRFHNAARTQQQVMIETRPPSTDSPRWDAFVAALAEWLAVRHRLRVPAWVHEPNRYLDQAEWITPMKSLYPSEYAGSPAAFQNHGIYIHRDSLQNV